MLIFLLTISGDIVKGKGRKEELLVFLLAVTVCSNSHLTFDPPVGAQSVGGDIDKRKRGGKPRKQITAVHQAVAAATTQDCPHVTEQRPLCPPSCPTIPRNQRQGQVTGRIRVAEISATVPTAAAACRRPLTSHSDNTKPPGQTQILCV